MINNIRVIDHHFKFLKTKFFFFIFILITSFSFLAPTKIVYAATQFVSLDTQLSNIELGQYFDDKKLNYDFFLHNTSPDTIDNIDISTSCGCTTVLTPRKFISSGKMMRISVTSDLIGKRGIILKELVVSYKHKNITKTQIITLSFSVIANIDAHKARKLNDVLFNEKCGKCHAIPAIGKTGKALFKAVCGFCHGENGGGSSAKGFTTVKFMKNFNEKQVKLIIEKGMPDGSMPGYLKDYGGPLTAEQVDSLIEYFKNKRKDFSRFIN